MYGIPLAFLVGYAGARYFGDTIKSIIHTVYTDISEWL